MVSRSLIPIVLVVTLSGCQSTPEHIPVPKDRIVEVPVEVCTNKYEGFTRELPVLPIHKLTPTSPPSDVSSSYYESINILMNEIRVYREAIGLE